MLSGYIDVPLHWILLSLEIPVCSRIKPREFCTDPSPGESGREILSPGQPNWLSCCKWPTVKLLQARTCLYVAHAAPTNFLHLEFSVDFQTRRTTNTSLHSTAQSWAQGNAPDGICQLRHIFLLIFTRGVGEIRDIKSISHLILFLIFLRAHLCFLFQVSILLLTIFTLVIAMSMAFTARSPRTPKKGPKDRAQRKKLKMSNLSNGTFPS